MSLHVDSGDQQQSEPNPYEVTGLPAGADIVGSVLGLPHGTWDDLRAIGHYQRRLTIAMIGYTLSLLVIVLMGVIRDDFAVPRRLSAAVVGPSLVALGVSTLAAAVLVWLMTLRLQPNRPVAAFQAILVLVPCLGLFVIANRVSRATVLLRRNGFPMGLLGVDPARLHGRD